MLGKEVELGEVQHGLALQTALAADPSTPGHLLASWATGNYETGPGYLYSSDDSGASWRPVTLSQSVNCITDIEFDPSVQGTVYLVAGGAGDTAPASGIYKSSQGGASGTWTRIDGKSPAGLSDAQTISIATHPQHLLFVGTQWTNNFACYRSADGGATWQRTRSDQGAAQYLFADGDSTRLYAATGGGLLFSSDAGDAWTSAAGAFGQLQILALADAQMNGHTIIYAATNGGQSSASAGPLAGTRAATLASSKTTIRAGIYRYVVLTPKLTLRLSGLSRSVCACTGTSASKASSPPAPSRATRSPSGCSAGLIGGSGSRRRPARSAQAAPTAGGTSPPRKATTAWTSRS